MDTSEQYIEMCKKAPEIQKHFITIGDYYYDKGEIEVCDNGQLYSAEMQDRMTFLPKQDQLQEMIEPIKDMFTIIMIVQEIYDFYSPSLCWPGDDVTDKEFKKEHEDHQKREEPRIKMISNIGSMEQLWLAFVMTKKHNKQWNDKKKEWVKV